MRILTFVSRDYLDLLGLWLDISVPNLPVAPTVVAMDDAAFAAAGSDPRCRVRLAPAEAADAPDRGLFWIRRLGLLLDEALAADGLFVHSDLDAFWLGDIATLLEGEDFDLAFSMDYGHPPEVGRVWGFTLCPGLFAARGGAGLAPVARRWMSETRRFTDDQNAINHLVRTAGIVWRPHDLRGWPARAGEIWIEGRTVRILAIPREICDRLLPIESDRGLMVAHPFFDRRFRTATVRLLSRLSDRDDRPAFTRPDLLGIARPSLRRNLLLRAGYGAVDPETLTAGELHHYGALEAAHGDPGRACALFDAALARGADPAEVGFDSHMALHRVGRKTDARRALAAAIPAGGTSHILRRFAADARAIGAPDLALRALIRLVGLSLGDPGRITRRLARAVRRYRPRR